MSYVTVKNIRNPGRVSDLAFSAFGDLSGVVSSASDYALLDKVQKRAVFIQSEISGIGKDEWDAALNTSSLVAAGWVPKENYSYDAMMSFWLGNIKSIITTDRNPATTEQVNEVDRLAGGTENLIALVKQNVSGAAVAKAEFDRAETEALLSKSKLLSPGDEGWKEFQTQLEDRAKSLAGAALPLGVIALIAALGIGAMIAFKK